MPPMPAPMTTTWAISFSFPGERRAPDSEPAAPGQADAELPHADGLVAARAGAHHGIEQRRAADGLTWRNHQRSAQIVRRVHRPAESGRVVLLHHARREDVEGDVLAAHRVLA